MGKKTAEEVRGFEYDWLAIDSGGYLGFFSSAGGGYVPVEVLRDTDAQDRAIANVLEAAEASIALFGPTLAPGLKNVWLQMAERGVFAFDSDPNGGPYRLVAKPETPIAAERLLRDPSLFACAVRYKTLLFADMGEIAEEFLVHEDGGTGS